MSSQRRGARLIRTPVAAAGLRLGTACLGVSTGVCAPLRVLSGNRWPGACVWWTAQMTRVLPGLVASLFLAGCDEGSTGGPERADRNDAGPTTERDSGDSLDPDPVTPGEDAGEPDLPDPDPVVPAGPFWHLERPESSERTWLVDPEGTRTFVLGVNTVMRNTTRHGAPRCDGIDAYIRRVDPGQAAHLEWARLSDGESGGHDVPRPYGFNSVGAWSETNDFDDAGGDSWMIRAVEDGGAGAPYGVVVSTAPGGADRALASEDGTVLENGVAGGRVGDPWNPAFLADLDAMVEREVAPRRADPRLQSGSRATRTACSIARRTGRACATSGDGSGRPSRRGRRSMRRCARGTRSRRSCATVTGASTR